MVSLVLLTVRMRVSAVLGVCIRVTVVIYVCVHHLRHGCMGGQWPARVRLLYRGMTQTRAKSPALVNYGKLILKQWQQACIYIIPEPDLSQMFPFPFQMSLIRPVMLSTLY